jgi:hypothetical protein
VKETPWRKGRDAAARYFAAFAEWRKASQFSRDFSNRPTAPENPYPLSRSRNGGAYQWQSGFNFQLRQEEAKRRNGGKPPCW